MHCFPVNFTGSDLGGTVRKKCYLIYSISAKSMFIIDFNQNDIKLVAYVSFLIEYFFKSIIYMLLAEMIYIQ